MKKFLQLLILSTCINAPAFAEVTYEKPTLETGIDVLNSVAYDSAEETYSLELHWTGNTSRDSFYFDLACAGAVQMRVWTRTISSFFRITVGSDLVARCGGTPLHVQVGRSSVPNLYLQVLDAQYTPRPASTSPVLSTVCQGEDRILNIGEYELHQAVTFGAIGSTCTENGMTPRTLQCAVNKLPVSDIACREGNSCSNNFHHGMSQWVGDGCSKTSCTKTTTRERCFDGAIIRTDEIRVEACIPRGQQTCIRLD